MDYCSFAALNMFYILTAKLKILPKVFCQKHSEIFFVLNIQRFLCFLINTKGLGDMFSGNTSWLKQEKKSHVKIWVDQCLRIVDGYKTNQSKFLRRFQFQRALAAL